MPSSNNFLSFGSTLSVDITIQFRGPTLLGSGRCCVGDCMFCLSPTNKSDCNLRIPDQKQRTPRTLICLSQIVTPNKRWQVCL